MSLSPCNSRICDGGYGFCRAPLPRGDTCPPRQQAARCHGPPDRPDIRTGRQVLGGLVAKERGGKPLPHGQAERSSGQRRYLLSSCSLSSGEQPVGFRDDDPMCLQSGDELLAQAVAGDSAANGLVVDWREYKSFLRTGKSPVSQFPFSEFSQRSSPAHYSRTVRITPPPPQLTPSCTRRSTLLTIAAGLAMQGGHASASSEESLSVGSQILRGLGLGDLDIYYPRVFQGTWDCFSTLVSVDTPQGEEMADLPSVRYAQKQLGYTVTYQARFIPYADRVIGDRVFTSTSLTEASLGKGVVIDSEWSPENPSQLSLTLRGGVKVENFVTKRSYEMAGPGRFDTSEFSRQVFDSSAIKDGPPSIKASQNLTRYKWDPDNEEVTEIKAIQRIAMFGVPGGSTGPNGLSTMDVLAMGGKPTTVYKYTVRLHRASQSLRVASIPAAATHS